MNIMSDEDSLSEMNVAPARLMPKSPSLTEHHRILGLSAVHAGNTISTLKAHKVRQDDIEERLEEIEDVRDAVWELKAKMTSQGEAIREHAEQVNKAMASHGDIIGQINQRLATQASNNDLKKTIVTGLIGIIMTAVTAYCGYTWGHSPPELKNDPMPTHQQAQEIDRKIQEFDPENVKRVNR